MCGAVYKPSSRKKQNEPTARQPVHLAKSPIDSADEVTVIEPDTDVTEQECAPTISTTIGSEDQRSLGDVNEEFRRNRLFSIISTDSKFSGSVSRERQNSMSFNILEQNQVTMHSTDRRFTQTRYVREMSSSFNVPDCKESDLVTAPTCGNNSCTGKHMDSKCMYCGNTTEMFSNNSEYESPRVIGLESQMKYTFPANMGAHYVSDERTERTSLDISELSVSFMKLPSPAESKLPEHAVLASNLTHPKQKVSSRQRGLSKIYAKLNRSLVQYKEGDPYTFQIFPNGLHLMNYSPEINAGFKNFDFLSCSTLNRPLKSIRKAISMDFYKDNTLHAARIIERSNHKHPRNELLVRNDTVVNHNRRHSDPHVLSNSRTSARNCTDVRQFDQTHYCPSINSTRSVKAFERPTSITDKKKSRKFSMC